MVETEGGKIDARISAQVNEAKSEMHNEDEVIGAVNIFRHNTSKTVPGLLA